MLLQDIGMLLASSSRSKAYLQMLVNHDLIPSHVIIMDDKKEALMPGQRISDTAEQLTEILIKHNISYEIVFKKDVNSKGVISALKRRQEKYFVYSGFGGGILKTEILNIGKRFIHIHAGIVPGFRGSTTIYYSILKEDQCGATALFLNDQIDCGEIIKKRQFSKPQNGKIIDFVYDAYIRACLLLEVMHDYVKRGSFNTEQQNAQAGETYFIIHPVLKHIAILSCGK